jgi:hypothetical protein
MKPEGQGPIRGVLVAAGKALSRLPLPMSVQLDDHRDAMVRIRLTATAGFISGFGPAANLQQETAATTLTRPTPPHCKQGISLRARQTAFRRHRLAVG